MKININTNANKMFMDVKKGETFLYENSYVCIKAYDYNEDIYVGVNLANGDILYIDDMVDVIVVDAELNVNSSPF